MSSDISKPSTPAAMFWIGWVLTILPVPLLVMSAVMKLIKAPVVIEGMTKMNWPAETIVPLGAVELVSTILYVIPQTSVLGAILLTGYLGGATATHVGQGDPYSQYLFPVVMGVILWLGLFLREARLRAILPLKL